jgi:hypothetical protein
MVHSVVGIIGEIASPIRIIQFVLEPPVVAPIAKFDEVEVAAVTSVSATVTLLLDVYHAYVAVDIATTSTSDMMIVIKSDFFIIFSLYKFFI